jgi:predicted esterase
MRLSAPDARKSFYDMPWPHALRMKTDGSLDLDDFPIPATVAVLRDNLPALAANTFGFGTNAPIYLAFDAPIDPDSLPADPEASLDPDASVFLADIDIDSPDYAQHVPLRYQYVDHGGVYLEPDVLIALPPPGFTLRPDTQYALIVTDRLRSADGEPVHASARFMRSRGDADAKATTAADKALAEAYAPLFAFVDKQHLKRSRVVAGTIFRTQDPTREMRAVAKAVGVLTPPALEGLDLFDVPADNPRESGNFTVLQGFYTAPVYQHGDPPYAASGGEFSFENEKGLPLLARMEQVQFVLTIPTGVSMPADGWPLLLYHHGSGGDATSFVRDGTAFHVAEAGLAMIGIDAPLHGLRNPTTGDATLLFFNVDNLRALRDNIRQGAADLLVLERFARALDVGAAASPTGEAIAFDPARMHVMGHSQGSLCAAIMLAMTDGISSAMLSGAGGSIAATIVYKEKPFPLLPLARTQVQVDADEVLDMFHPVLGIVQALSEVSDPLNYVPYYYRWQGGHGLDLWLSSGLNDQYVPPIITNALATAAGVSPAAPVVEPIEGLALSGLKPLPLPLSGNRTGVDGGKHTAVISQYFNADHFLIQENPTAEAQLTHWFASAVKSSRAELVSGR